MITKTGIEIHIHVHRQDDRHYPGELRAFYERMRDLTSHTSNDCLSVAMDIEDMAQEYREFTENL